MKKFISGLMVVVISAVSFVPSLAVSSSEKDKIDKAINVHVEKLKSYNSQVEQNYFKQYTDIGNSAYRGFIGRLIHTGITKGTSNTTFSPKVQVNGGQFITLLLRAMGYNLTEQAGQPYYAPYIAEARELKIIEPAEMTNPLRIITQREVARIVVKALELWDTIEMNKYYGEVFYKGEGYWGDAFKPFIKKVIASGVMGLDYKTGLFEATKPLTREEMSMVIVKFAEKTRRTPYDKDKPGVIHIRGLYSHWEDNKVFDKLTPADRFFYGIKEGETLLEYYKRRDPQWAGRQTTCFYEPSQPEFTRIVKAMLEYEKTSKRAFMVVAMPERSGPMDANWLDVRISPEPERNDRFVEGSNNDGTLDVVFSIVPTSSLVMVRSFRGVERQKQMFNELMEVYEIILGKGKGLDTVRSWYQDTIFKNEDYGGEGQPFLGIFKTNINGKNIEVNHQGGCNYCFWIYY